MTDDEIPEIAKAKIRPIVEFFLIDIDGKNDREFIDTRLEDRKHLRDALKSTKGLYAFYNSELEIIYVGKTKNNLWTEMISAFNREMGHYERYYVQHPHGKYKETSDGKVRHIRNRKFYLYDSAYCFSAYAINDNDIIDLIELMMIRMMPNDLLNRRIEGNNSLNIYQSEA